MNPTQYEVLHASRTLISQTESAKERAEALVKLLGWRTSAARGLADAGSMFAGPPAQADSEVLDTILWLASPPDELVFDAAKRHFNRYGRVQSSNEWTPRAVCDAIGRLAQRLDGQEARLLAAKNCIGWLKGASLEVQHLVLDEIWAQHDSYDSTQLAESLAQGAGHLAEEVRQRCAALVAHLGVRPSSAKTILALGRAGIKHANPLLLDILQQAWREVGSSYDNMASLAEYAQLSGRQDVAKHFAEVLLSETENTELPVSDRLDALWCAFLIIRYTNEGALRRRFRATVIPRPAWFPEEATLRERKMVQWLRTVLP